MPRLFRNVHHQWPFDPSSLRLFWNLLLQTDSEGPPFIFDTASCSFEHVLDTTPHRSVRAALPHTALTLDAWRRSARWGTDAECVGRESTAGLAPPGVPSSVEFSARGGATAAARAESPAAGTSLRCAYCPVPRDS